MILIYKSWIILYMPNTSVAEKGSGIQYWRIYACTFPVLTCVVLYVVLTHLCMFFPSIDMCCTSIDTFTVCTKLYQYCHMYLSTVLLMTLAVYTVLVLSCACTALVFTYVLVLFITYTIHTYCTCCKKCLFDFFV